MDSGQSCQRGGSSAFVSEDLTVSRVLLLLKLVGLSKVGYQPRSTGNYFLSWTEMHILKYMNNKLGLTCAKLRLS